MIGQKPQIGRPWRQKVKAYCYTAAQIDHQYFLREASNDFYRWRQLHQVQTYRLC